MRLFIVRHGTAFERDEEKRYLGVKEDPSISAEGHRQAEALARALRRRGIRPGVVISGPQRRQQETSSILAKKLGVTRRATSPWLSEIDYGPWEGLSKEEILAKWPKESQAWKKRGEWPDGVFGGTFEDVQARLRGWLDHLKDFKAETAIAVTSQGTLRGLFALADPVAWQALRETGRATYANVDNGSWCELDIGDAGAKVLGWNRAPSFVDRLSFLG